jgi:gluconate kinase
MDKREDHYMKTGMLESQFEILEPPENALYLYIERPITALVQESIAFIEEISRER